MDFNDFLKTAMDTEQKISICSLQEGRGMTGVRGLNGKVSHATANSRESADRTEGIT